MQDFFSLLTTRHLHPIKSFFLLHYKEYLVELLSSIDSVMLTINRSGKAELSLFLMDARGDAIGSYSTSNIKSNEDTSSYVCT